MAKSPRSRSVSVAGHRGIETLESRTLMSVTAWQVLAHPGTALAEARPHQSAAANHAGRGHHRHAGPANPNLVVKPSPDGTTWSGAGHGPPEIRSVYGFGAIAGQGAGQTIAIVDAYDDPNIAGDLAQFDAQFSLPGTNTSAAGTTGSVYDYLTKVGQKGPFGGAVKAPKANGSWAQEIALDVEWAHAIAPGAKILLVEANSASDSDLLAAVDYGRQHASVVSMSWGGSEFSTEASSDSHFTSPTVNGVTNNVTFVASSGDTGGVREWPAEAPNVVSVGGTTLFLSGYAAYDHENGWSGSGGGTSAYEQMPSYQGAVAPTLTASGTKRSGPDVGYDGDPNSGFAVYDSYRYLGRSGWMVFGGTSAGAPQWAGLIAAADQARVSAGKGALDGSRDVLPALYNGQVATLDFHDIVSGNTSGGTTSGPGYDQVTGQGSPFADRVISDLVNNVA
jgi:subtilase family serine protease